MKTYHKNPRQITRDQYESLEQWLRELGDLGGIVHNIPTDEIVGGNQRGRIFGLDEARIVIEEEYDEPDEQGTVAWGHVLWEGHRYSYRAVVWDERTCEQANIVANKAGGSWDWDVLADKFEVGDLLDWGFDNWELGVFEDQDADMDELWEGMPEFENEAGAVKTVYVHFASMDDVAGFAELVDQPITEKTKSIWYPAQDWEHHGVALTGDEVPGDEP